MKKIAAVIMFLVCLQVRSQEPLYTKIRQRIQAEHPELKLDNKLLVVNIWSVGSVENRNKNIQLNKAFATYEFAKLKGGLKGMVGVSICVDGDLNQQEIALGKDKVTKLIQVNNPSTLGIEQAGNMIYDSAGQLVKKDVSGDLFTEINKLITR